MGSSCLCLRSYCMSISLVCVLAFPHFFTSLRNKFMLSNRLSNSLLAVICDHSTGTFHLKLTPSKSCITHTHTAKKKEKSSQQYKRQEMSSFMHHLDASSPFHSDLGYWTGTGALMNSSWPPPPPLSTDKAFKTSWSRSCKAMKAASKLLCDVQNLDTYKPNSLHANTFRLLQNFAHITVLVQSEQGK